MANSADRGSNGNPNGKERSGGLDAWEIFDIPKDQRQKPVTPAVLLNIDPAHVSTAGIMEAAKSRRALLAPYLQGQHRAAAEKIIANVDKAEAFLLGQHAVQKKPASTVQKHAQSTRTAASKAGLPVAHKLEDPREEREEEPEEQEQASRASRLLQGMRDRVKKQPLIAAVVLGASVAIGGVATYVGFSRPGNHPQQTAAVDPSAQHPAAEGSAPPPPDQVVDTPPEAEPVPPPVTKPKPPSTAPVRPPVVTPPPKEEPIVIPDVPEPKPPKVIPEKPPVVESPPVVEPPPAVTPPPREKPKPPAGPWAPSPAAQEKLEKDTAAIEAETQKVRDDATVMNQARSPTGARELLKRAGEDMERAEAIAVLRVVAELASQRGDAQVTTAVFTTLRGLDAPKSIVDEAAQAASKAVRDFSKKATRTGLESRGIVSHHSLSVYEYSVQELDEYQEAQSMSRWLKTSLPPEDQPRLTRLQQYAEKIKEMAPHVNTALDTVSKDPSDPQANQTLGLYFCFTKGQWERGLPHLAQSSNGTLRKLAEDTLAASSKSGDLLELAKQWSTCAKAYPKVVHGASVQKIMSWALRRAKQNGAAGSELTEIDALLKTCASAEGISVAGEPMAQNLLTSVIRNNYKEVRGSWQKGMVPDGRQTRPVLLAKPTKEGRSFVAIPITECPQNYRLKVNFIRHAGSNNAIAVTFPVVSGSLGEKKVTMGTFVVDIAGVSSGFQGIGDLTERKAPVTPKDARNSLTIEVRSVVPKKASDGDSVSIDATIQRDGGKATPLAHWEGPVSRVTLPKEWKLDEKMYVGLGVYGEVSASFHGVDLAPADTANNSDPKVTQR